MTAYLTDSVGAFLAPVGLPCVPGIGIQIPANVVEVSEVLPPPAEGCVWALEGGKPAQVIDHRGAVFDTKTGEPLEYGVLGELPTGLVSIPRPSALHRWLNGQWQLDEKLKLEQLINLEREWRDMEIRRTDDLVIRHRDELELEESSTLNAEQYRALQVYRLDLRHWPQSPGFPRREQRPRAPA